MKNVVLGLMCVLLFSGCQKATAYKDSKRNDSSGAVQASTQSTQACEYYGPQTPRDISQRQGNNNVMFPMALPSENMNLCNIHFHNSAEHKSPAFSIPAAMKANGESGGFQCAISKDLTASELKPFANNQCKGIKPGDTVEFHWVHSSCDVKPGVGLGACLSDGCANPSLRVETQVFTVVNDPNALNFADFTYSGRSEAGYHQAANIPAGTGTPVEFLGSTTGPSYTEQACSSLQVTWSVRPQCAKVDISSLSQWCANNPYDENDAHGVRKLVTNPDLLSPIN